MRCLGCGSTAVTERPERTAQGYRRFRCRQCRGQFNERSTSQLNRTQYPSDVMLIDGTPEIVLYSLDSDKQASSGGESHPSALSGSVEDWRRAGSADCDHATFSSPSTSHATCGFPALRAPICFMPVLIGPIVLGQLST